MTTYGQLTVDRIRVNSYACFAISCPKCLAAIGEPCVSRSHVGTSKLLRPHNARSKKYWSNPVPTAHLTGIATGFGNDDRLMEQALDMEEGREEVSRKAYLEARAAKIMEEIDRLELLGEDVYRDETVLYIKFRFNGNSTEYNYAALKVGGNWFLTGARAASYKSWDDMLEFFKAGDITEIWMAKNWERVV